MKIIKNIFSIFGAFILMIAILCFTVCSIGQNYTNKEYIVKKLEENEAYKQIYDEIHQEFSEYAKQLGIEITSLKTVCNEEKIKKDFLAVIDYIFEEKELVIDTEEIKLSLDTEIRTKLENQNRKITKEESESAVQFEEKIANYYKETFENYAKIKETINDKIKILNQVGKAKNICIIVSIICGILIILINIKEIFHGLGFIGTAILSAGGILAITPSVIYMKSDLSSINSEFEFVVDIASSTIKEILNQMSVLGAKYICVGIVVVFVTSIISGILRKE